MFKESELRGFCTPCFLDWESQGDEQMDLPYWEPELIAIKPCHLKGTVSRDFLLLVFFLNQFPPSLWLYYQGRFEFFRKFAEIFAAQGWTFKQKNFNNFVWTPLGSRVNIYINFCLQVHFKVSAAWYCCHYLTPVANLSPVSLIPVAICHRRRWHRWQICRRYRWHRRQICHRYQQR